MANYSSAPQQGPGEPNRWNPDGNCWSGSQLVGIRTTQEQCTPAKGVSSSPPVASPTGGGNVVGASPFDNGETDLEPSGNVYKDADGVIRNRRQAAEGPRAGINAGGNYNPSYSGSSGGGTPGFGFDSYGGAASSAGSGGYSPSNPWGVDGIGGTRMPGGSTGTIRTGGGGSMATGTGDVYNAQLGQLGATVSGLANPSMGPMPRTLYDKYSNLLQNPGQIANDPAYQLMMEQALKASNRQLSAGRMSKSGNAAIQAANVATGNTGQYLRQLSDIYGAGAGMEANRYGTEASAASTGYRDLLSKYQTAGNLYSGAGVQTPAPAAWVNPYANFQGDYRANMNQQQLAEAMSPRPTSYFGFW